MNNYIGKYYIDDKFVEHNCCWDSAIVIKCKDGDGQYGKDTALVLECNSEDAEFICSSLNSTLEFKE